jgi:hypothetical protein
MPDNTKNTPTQPERLKDEASSEDEFVAFKEFTMEFKNETDRAAVVLGAAKLDYLLYQILGKYLLPNPSTRDDLFEGDGPLSSFSAKIQMAYRLALIDAAFARALNLVRKIRNAFAHELSGCSLDSGAHSDRVKELFLPLKTHGAVRGLRTTFFGDKSGCRADFYTALGGMVIRLEGVLRRVQGVDQSQMTGLVPPEQTGEK